MDNLKSIKVGQPEYFNLKARVPFYLSLMGYIETLDFLVQSGLNYDMAYQLVFNKSNRSSAYKLSHENTIRGTVSGRVSGKRPSWSILDDTLE